MIALKKKDKGCLKKQKSQFWKENPFLKAKKAELYGTIKIKTDGKPGQIHREMWPPTLEDSTQQLVMPPFAYSFHTHLKSAVSKLCVFLRGSVDAVQDEVSVFTLKVSGTLVFNKNLFLRAKPKDLTSVHR